MKKLMKSLNWFNIFIIVLLITVSSNAQVYQEWLAAYNGFGSGEDQAYAMAVDNSGNVYVTGMSKGNGTDWDYATVKYNSSGVQQWASRYNGPINADDKSVAIAIDGSGNVYVTGYSPVSATYYDYLTIKYNSSGVQQWASRYSSPGANSDFAKSIAVDNSGNVYVTGSSTGTYDDYLTIKYNSSGDTVWTRRYNGGLNTDIAYSVKVDNSGFIYVTGSSNSNTGIPDYATIKYNSAGDIIWVKRYSGVGNSTDEALALALDNTGNVYVTGRSSIGASYFDYATVKYNSNGDSLWVKRYNGIGNSEDEANSIAVDTSGNVYVSGFTEGGSTFHDYCTIKYNSSGVQQWVRTYNGPPVVGSDKANSLALDRAGNVYVTGQSQQINGPYDYATIKYNPVGDSVWVKRYNGSTNSQDLAYSIAVDSSGNVYVTGATTLSSIDYGTIKYSQNTGIQQISNEIPVGFSLSQNYPNPFNPVTSFKFQVPGFSLVKIEVFDILGREIATLVNEQLKPGTYEVDWDGTNFSSGVYYYKLSSDEFTVTKKMIFVK